VPELEAAFREKEAAQRGALDQVQRLQRDLQDCVRRRQKTKSDLEEAKDGLSGVSKNGKDLLAGIPGYPAFRALENAIKSARFKFPPVGPVGKQ
jgi:hypothetical protein